MSAGISAAAGSWSRSGSIPPWGRGLYGYADIVTGRPPWAVLDLKTGYGAPTWDQLALYGMWLILERARSIEGEGEVRR